MSAAAPEGGGAAVPGDANAERASLHREIVLRKLLEAKLPTSQRTSVPASLDQALPPVPSILPARPETVVDRTRDFLRAAVVPAPSSLPAPAGRVPSPPTAGGGNSGSSGGLPADRSKERPFGERRGAVPVTERGMGRASWRPLLEAEELEEEGGHMNHSLSPSSSDSEKDDAAGASAGSGAGAPPAMLSAEVIELSGIFFFKLDFR